MRFEVQLLIESERIKHWSAPLTFFFQTAEFSFLQAGNLTHVKQKYHCE